MEWAELITVRSNKNNSQALAATLRELMEDVVRRAGPEKIRMYRRKRLDTDFCIVLFHEGEKDPIDGSRLGLRLAAALKDFGIVHHAVWIEMDRQVED